MTPEALRIIEGLFKAFVFVPTIALVAWWIFTNWMEQSITLQEAGVALLLVGIAFALGVISIASGGWGFLGVIAFVYLALLALAVWQYLYWRRAENEHYRAEVRKYLQAIEADPTNAAAFSFLGQSYLRLNRFEEAQKAIQTALQLDPESKHDRRLLRLAEQRRAQYPWLRTD